MKTLHMLVGMKYRGTTDRVARLPAGTSLLLRREPDNEHDTLAIAVWDGVTMLGYIAAKTGHDLARRMDARNHDHCEGTLAVTADRWPHVEVNYGWTPPAAPAPEPSHEPRIHGKLPPVD